MAFLVLTSIIVLKIASVLGAINPFKGAYFFPNPNYAIEVNSSIKLHPSEANIMKIASQQAAAFWMDTVSHISKADTYLAQANNEANKRNSPVLISLIVYNVPDRDCAAEASAGQFHCEDETCEGGINDYKTQYIAPIVTMLKKYQNNANLRIVLIIEPDSLPNLATNLGNPKCQQAQNAYMTCISYAIKELSAFKNTHLYVDAAHGGWLGWSTNMQKFAPIIQKVLANAGGASKIRGFSDNVANYQWLANVNNTADPCNLQSQYNFCNNEAVYMSKMNQVLEQYIGTKFYWVTDTGRNGVETARVGTQQCQQWCNIKNAGLGYKPSTNVSWTGIEDILDALFWLKTPGESDGTTNTSSPYFDPHCVSSNSLQPAPNAGYWFDADFDMLAKNSIWKS